MAGQRARAARARQFGGDPGKFARRQQVEPQFGAAVGGDGVAQHARPGIDQAAFDAAGGDQRIRLARVAAAGGVGEAGGHRLQRLAGKAFGKCALQPVSKPQLAGSSGVTATPCCASSGSQAPSEPSRAQLPPPSASTTASASTRRSPSAACEAQLPPAVGAFAPAEPAMAHVKLHAGLAQLVQPGAQQGRGFHVEREHAARAADEGVDAELAAPRPATPMGRTGPATARLAPRARRSA